MPAGPARRAAYTEAGPASVTARAFPPPSGARGTQHRTLSRLAQLMITRRPGRAAMCERS